MTLTNSTNRSFAASLQLRRSAVSVTPVRVVSVVVGDSAEILKSCSEERSDDMTDCGADRINAEWLIYLVDDEFDAF